MARHRSWIVARLLAVIATCLVPVAVSAQPCEIRNGVVVHGSRLSHDIALTFDACPTSHRPGFSPDIVDQLRKDEVPATFFVSGRWAEAYPHELAQIATLPSCEIALHGYRHRRLNGATPQAILAEIEDGRQALLRLGAKPRPLFRPPFGDQPAALAATAQQAGVTPVLWDVAPGDPVASETAADIERDVLQRAHGGSIVVLHVNGRGVHTPAALPALIARLRQRGFRFVTVSELIRECAVSEGTASEEEVQR